MNLRTFVSQISVFSSAIALSVSLAGSSAAAPDLDGAADALVATAFEPAGDAVGGAGLVAASVVGGVGDLVALIDDNRYSRHVLHGVGSRNIDRAALGISNMLTGSLEGFRGQDFVSLPEQQRIYLGAPESAESRAKTRGLTFARGISALVSLTVVDAVTNPVLILAELAGAEGPADAIESWKNGVADTVLGSRQ